MCKNMARSLLDLWGTNTTSEKNCSPAVLADSTRSPTDTSEMNLDRPDSTITVSDPAKHVDLFRDDELSTTDEKIGNEDGLKDADWIALDGASVGDDT